MAGELTASSPVLATTPAEIKAAVDALTLAAVTDFIMVVPKTNSQFYVFKIERSA